MSPREIEPLDADLLPFVDAERDHLGDVPDGARARLAAGVLARIAAGGSGEGGPGGHDGHSRPAQWVRARPLSSMSLVFGVGAVAGALVRGLAQSDTPQPPQVVYIDRPEPPLATTGTTPVIPAAPPAVSSAGPNPPRVAAAASTSHDETRERILLDSARQALVRGEPQAAWEAIRTHEREFPSAVLAEERDAMAVRALVALGRGAEAHHRAAALRARSPHSVFLPAAESALTSLLDAGHE